MPRQRKSILIKYMAVLVALGFVAMAIPTPVQAEVPILNSAPEAPHAIYLDFDGHFEPRSTHTCPPPVASPEGWPIDLDVSDISGDIDASSVRRIWDAVAEDFAPFFVNVTTDPTREPSRDSDTGTAIRVAIGMYSIENGLGHAPATCDQDILANPPYLNPRIANVAVVRLNPLGSYTEREVAKRISHEAGHLYGLLHHLAPAAPIDDWIMAPQRSATRYIWRSGTNDSNAPQDDVAQLARLLIRRPDEPREPTFLSTVPPSIQPLIFGRLYAHGTLETPNDIDEFLFTVNSTGPLAVTILGGTWVDPASQNPEPGTEANFRPIFQVRSHDGWAKLACPEGTSLTLTATSDNIILPPPSFEDGRLVLFPCPSTPSTLQVGETYRVWVTRHATNRLEGNLGRYTILVNGPVSGSLWPGFPRWFVWAMEWLQLHRIERPAPTSSLPAWPDLQAPIQHAVSYLQDEYNTAIGLIRESPETAPNHYWLATDNWLAALALRPYDPELAGALAHTIETYGGVEHGLIEALIGEIVEWPPHVARQEPVSPEGVWVEQRDQDAQYEDWAEYSDLSLYRALNAYNEGQTEEALQLYRQALKQFDGVGFADKAWQADEVRYATYKLALSLYVGGQIGETPEKEILSALLSKQADSGGFTALYEETGEPVGDTNTETTAYALLALYQLAGAR